MYRNIIINPNEDMKEQNNFDSNLKKNVWSNEKIVISPLPDIEVPETTVLEFIWRNLDKWSNKIATICAVTNRSYTYEDIYRHSKIFGAYLKSKFGIRDGDIIAVILPNVPEYATVTIGILAAGGIVSTFNPIYTAFELQKQLILSEAQLIITHPDVVPNVREALKLSEQKLSIISVDIDKEAPEGTASYKKAFLDDHADLNVLKEVKRCPSDVAFLPYSSGTTGLPKGVELTNRNIVANCLMQSADGARQYLNTTASHQDVIPVVLPLFHAYALLIIMLHKMSNGVKLVIIPRFHPETYLDALIKHRATLLYLAPPTALFLGSSPMVTSKHFEHVRWITVAAAPTSEADIQKVLAKTGRDIQFSQAYGLTEVSPLATLGFYGFKNYLSVGHALPSVKLRVVDAQNNNLGPGEVGELLINGPLIMKGYKNNPQANKEVFLEGGWFRSGDLAKIDETGAVYIVDRLKELIKVKGYQVPPAELEGVIKEHPSVHDVAVVGYPDTATGETPRAFIVLKEGYKPDANVIIDFVAKKVAPYKKVKEVTFVESIPKNPSGKILRRVIKNKYS